MPPRPHKGYKGRNILSKSLVDSTLLQFVNWVGSNMSLAGRIPEIYGAGHVNCLWGQSFFYTPKVLRKMWRDRGKLSVGSKFFSICLKIADKSGVTEGNYLWRQGFFIYA